MSKLVPNYHRSKISQTTILSARFQTQGSEGTRDNLLRFLIPHYLSLHTIKRMGDTIIDLQTLQSSHSTNGFVRDHTTNLKVIEVNQTVRYSMREGAR